MELTIMYRNSFDGGDGWRYYPVTIQVGDECLQCGGPRALPHSYTFCEDGEWFTVDQWDNECGHIETYKSVWDEWQTIQDDDIPSCFGTHQVVDIG